MDNSIWHLIERGCNQMINKNKTKFYFFSLKNENMAPSLDVLLLKMLLIFFHTNSCLHCKDFIINFRKNKH